MPALVVFGRRWHIGSDDLVLPSFLDLIIRISWLVVTIVIYWETDLTPSSSEDADECPRQEEYVRLLFYLAFTLLHVTIIADVGILQNSKIGSCMEVESRRSVPKWIYMRSLLYLCDIAFSIFVTLLDYNEYFECGDISNGNVMKCMVMSNWTLTALAVFLIIVTFDPLGKQDLSDAHFIGQGSDGDDFLQMSETRQTKLWDLRCRLIGCACNDRPDEDAFKEVGKIIGTSLTGVDLVLSDYIAGLTILCLRNTRQSKAMTQILVDKENKSEFQSSLPRVPITMEPLKIKPVGMEPLDSTNWTSLPILNHFLKYGLASYTWRFLPSRKNPVKEMWTNSHCCYPANVEGDCCCSCNVAAIQTIAETDVDDLLNASFKNDYFQQQYFVAVDHSTQTIILSICGTISHKDYITDLTCWPVQLVVPGLPLPPDFMVHRGFLQSAKVLRKKLEENQVLADAHKKYPHYCIVLTGHSLGAATATILGIMLKAKYPSLKCYAYSPPGACLSAEAAEYCEGFVASVTYGDDLACRLTIQSCEKIKDKIFQALLSCKTPKYRILLRTCCILGGASTSSIDEEYSTDDSNLNMKKSNLSVDDEKFKIPALAKQVLTQCPRLYPPGQILHITEIPEYSFRRGVDGYEPTSTERWEYRWANREEFEDLVISTRMGLDHIPYRMSKSLRQLASTTF